MSVIPNNSIANQSRRTCIIDHRASGSVEKEKARVESSVTHRSEGAAIVSQLIDEASRRGRIKYRDIKIKITDDRSQRKATDNEFLMPGKKLLEINQPLALRS